MMTAYYIIIASTTVLMLIGLLIAVKMKRTAANGTHKKAAGFITTFTTFLTGVFCSAALIPLLSIEFSLIIMGTILFLVGIYVIGLLLIIRKLLNQSR